MTQLNLDSLSKEDMLAEIQRREKAERKAEQEARKAYETDKKDYLVATASKFQQLHNEMKELKELTIREANKLYNRIYELNGKEPKEVKTFQLKNEDETIKVTVERQERFAFTEEAVVHITAIKDIFKEKFAQRNKSLYSLLDGLLIKNSNKDYDPKLLTKLRQQIRSLDDKPLMDEFDKLLDCQRVVGTSMYCRLYVKNEYKKWEDVTLNFSSL